MKVTAENVGDSSPYLTAGKEYEVIADACENGGSIIDDVGDKIYIKFEECAHLEMNKWTVADR